MSTHALKTDGVAMLDAICAEHRHAGFPLYSFTFDERKAELSKLLKFNHAALLESGVVKQTMHGLALAWHYQPHSWGIRCGNMHTPMEVFADDCLFRRAVRKRMAMGQVSSQSELRKALRTITGVQAVSNFRPTAAAAIYHAFLPEEGGAVWDMSAGFGGRLLGALACHKVTRYIGTDPATLTMDGLTDMVNDLLPMMSCLGYGAPRELQLCTCGSEEYTPAPESLSLCFTSPPYFNWEQYPDESTQSYLKFPTKKTWMEGYLRPTLANCHIGLMPQGKLVINIASVKSYPELQRDFLRMAEATGWQLEQTLWLCLSTMMGTRRNGEKHKLEPIFVFRKR